MADALAKGKTPEADAAQQGGGDDAFVRSAYKTADWLQNNLRSVTLGGVGLALILAGAWYYVNFQASVREQAAGELATLRIQARPPEALIPSYEAYIGRFDGTTPADEARIILARMYLETAQPAEAMRVVGDVSEPADRPLGFAALSLLASAQEAAGDAEAAMGTWESLGRDARFPFQRRSAQASVARLHAAAGRTAEAATIYAAIAEEAAEDDEQVEAGVYRIRLGELTASPQGS